MLVLVSPNPIKTFLKGPGHPFLISNSQVDCIITVLYQAIRRICESYSGTPDNGRKDSKESREVRTTVSEGS